MVTSPITIQLLDADILLYPQLYNLARADALMHQLESEIDWRQDQIRLYGRIAKLPRLTAWYGDTDKRYAYSGIKMDPLPWTPGLSATRKQLETLTGDRFNSVLLNLYRDGNDAMGWHSDDEKTLGSNPVIGSLSLGATRRFSLQHKTVKHLRHSIDLTHGSYLLMAGATQHHWRHRLAKTRRHCETRINLTFRYII